MKHFVLGILIVLFLCPTGALGYSIDILYSEPTHTENFIEIYCWQDPIYEGVSNNPNEGSPAIFDFVVTADGSEPMVGNAEVVVTWNPSVTAFQIYSSSNFDDLTYEEIIPESVSITYNVAVGEQLCTTLPDLWALFPTISFTEFPTPVDPSLSASAYIYAAVGWTPTAKINGVSPVPEPATILIFGAGLAGLAGTRRRKMKKNSNK